MKTIINTVKSIFNSENAKKQTIKCNYADNYYGDQYCQ